MVEAIIFDMDGVIIDSERYWQQDEFWFIKKLIPSWSQSDQQKIVGLHLTDIYELLSANYDVKIEKGIFIAEIEKIALQIYSKHIQLMPKFIKTIESLRNLKVGLASSAKREWIDIAIQRFGLSSYFDVTLSAEEVIGPGKPAPDIYLQTAQLLDINPKKCIVIEDSVNGIKAAKSAGMTCVGFRSELNSEMDLSEADLIMNGFGEFDKILENLKILDFKKIKNVGT